MSSVNPFIERLKPYQVASHKVWEVNNEERKSILKLDWNEATIPPSPKVKEALLEHIQQDNTFSLYPNTHNTELLNLLSEYCAVTTDRIQYFASSDAAHEYIVKLYLQPQDKVLILGPTYDNFRLTCESQGAIVAYTTYGEGFVLNELDIELAIAENQPKLVYLCNPNNPTGNLLSRDWIKQLLVKFPEIVFLVDEAYHEFSGVSNASDTGEFTNLFISRTFSKAFALAGFRAGYLISHAENIEKINRIRNAKNFTTLTQVAVIAALKDFDYTRSYIAEVNETKNWFSQQVADIISSSKVYSSYGNYVLIELTSQKERDHIFNELAKENIFVRSLSHHPSLNHCFRITIGTKNQMQRVCEVLKAMFQ